MDGGSVPDRLAPVHQTQPVGGFEHVLMMMKQEELKIHENNDKNYICAKTGVCPDVPIPRACWH